MRNIFFTLLLVIGMTSMGYAQESKVLPKTADLSAPSKVDGLELPADQTVSFDEGFINLTAKCSGQVKWLVVSVVKVKYQTIPQNNSIIISVPPGGGLITVFAIGVVDGKMTEFARTNINVATPVNGGPDPIPNPKTGVIAPPVEGPLHVTFLIDMNNPTPALTQLLNSQSLRTAVQAKGFFRIYDIKAPVVAEKKLDALVAKVGGSAVMIVQRNDGAVISAVVIPNTEAAILAVVNGSK